MNLDLNHFRKKLEEERTDLERQLQKIGKRDPENPTGWEPKQPDLNPLLSDAGELADVFEAFENQASVEAVLEERLREVQDAIKRIEDGTYGFCAEDKNPINPERLEANPAAKTCIEHSS